MPSLGITRQHFSWCPMIAVVQASHPFQDKMARQYESECLSRDDFSARYIQFLCLCFELSMLSENHVLFFFMRLNSGNQTGAHPREGESTPHPHGTPLPGTFQDKRTLFTIFRVCCFCLPGYSRSFLLVATENTW